MIDWWEVKTWLREKTVDFCVWLIKRVERYKNESLSWRLHNLADEYYARRPTGQWNYRDTQ